jgi:teichoic acid transport system permease protein
VTELRLPATAPAPDVPPTALLDEMHRAGARPSLTTYLAQLWQRRHFLVSYTRANNEIMYSRSFLGQLWQLLTPLLNAAVYYLIFGLLLHTRRGVHNYVAFLVIGIFVFHFLQQSIIRGSRSIANNGGLIRSLHFPRAVLPISSTGQTGIQLLVSMAVLIPIVLVTGETPTLRWLLLVPALFLTVMFALGASLAIARVSAHIPDTTALLPFILRTWLYCSGIFYNIEVMARDRPTVRLLLHLNPGAEYVELARSALIEGYRAPGYMWWLAAGWALVAVVGGTAFFWQAEETYARG